MASLLDNLLGNNMTVGDVKCRTELSEIESAPNGDCDKSGGSKSKNSEVEERKKKTRRRKSKRKNPYIKNNMPENRGGKKSIRARAGKCTYQQPVAPYNSNQFLIEDHNDLKDLDMKLMEAAIASKDQPEITTRPARVRDPSFTSADSDEDFFYSSPEDEEEFLTKEFSNTYQDLHVESLTNMSKSELIQTVVHLEEKIDVLQKRIGKAEPEATPDERIHSFQNEITKLVLQNQKLANENSRLREITGKCSSSSSEDSESDSTSSSEQSSEGTQKYKHMNGDAHKSDDIDMEPTDNT